jgi:hypothetical protein
MMHHLVETVLPAGGAGPDRHFQGVQDQVGAQVIGDLPADDHPGETNPE